MTRPFLALSFVHRDLIIKLATDYRLPAVHPNRVFVAAGGFISYGDVQSESWRRARQSLQLNPNSAVALAIAGES